MKLASANSADQFCLEASDRASLMAGFGVRGRDLSHFPTRAARRRANNGLEEELYVLRRFLFSMEAAGAQLYPVRLSKSETPDFCGTLDGLPYGIEVTEATNSADQREMTLRERSNEAALLGAYGGRYPHGVGYGGKPRGSLADRDLVSDILRAIRRKRLFPYSVERIDLLLYANGNAAMMAYAVSAAPLLEERLQRWWHHLTTATPISRLAIVWDNEEKLALWGGTGGLRLLNLRETLD